LFGQWERETRTPLLLSPEDLALCILSFDFVFSFARHIFAEYVAQTNLCVTDDAQIHSSSDLVELPFTRELLLSETASFKTARRSRNR